MLSGLTMCELSVDDGEQQNEQDETDRNRCDDRNDTAETWVQNQMMNDHKIEIWVQNELTDGHKCWNHRSWYRNWIQSKSMDGHKSWKHKISHRKWIQSKMTDGYESEDTDSKLMTIESRQAQVKK